MLTRSLTPAVLLLALGALTACDAVTAIEPSDDVPAVEEPLEGLELANDLLSRANGTYVLPSCADCTDGIPPKIRVNTALPYDLHVYAAVVHAWEAVGYYRHGALEDAEASLQKMEAELERAAAYCPIDTGNRHSSVMPYTLEIWSCPDA